MTGDPRYANASWNNQIYIMIIPAVSIDPVKVSDVVLKIARKYERRLAKIGISTVELVGKMKNNKDGTIMKARFVGSNPTAHKFQVEGFVEQISKSTGKPVLLPVYHSHKKLAPPTGTLISFLEIALHFFLFLTND